MDDWEEAQFNNRHVHNRVGASGRKTSAFDVKKILGTYEVKCPAASKPSAKDDSHDSDGSSKLEVFTLNQAENAVIGEIVLVGVLHATVLLAGSRKTMNAVVRDLEPANVDLEDGSVLHGKQEDDNENVSTGDRAELTVPRDSDEERSEQEQRDSEDDEEDQDLAENKRFKEFEKNSFRSPKFWVKWQGQISSPAAMLATQDETVTDTGYIIFSGKHCERFQGTISCVPLGWKNVKISGMKVRSRPPRDFTITWISG